MTYRPVEILEAVKPMPVSLSGVMLLEYSRRSGYELANRRQTAFHLRQCGYTVSGTRQVFTLFDQHRIATIGSQRRVTEDQTEG